MSTNLEHPILSAARFERPPSSISSLASAGPNNDGADNMGTQASSTPSHSSAGGLKDTSWSADSCACSAPPGISGDLHTSGQIRIMENELVRARQHRELPRTTASPMDTTTIIEDYGYLTRLREARGDVTSTPTEAYKELRVEISRKIQLRDAAASDEEIHKEAVSRIKNYLRSVEHEQASLDTAATTPQSLRNGSAATWTHDDVKLFTEELLPVIEQAVGQTIIESAEPLRLQIRRLGECVLQQQEAAKALGALFGPQCEAIQATNGTLQHSTVILHQLFGLLPLVDHLAQVVTNLPLALDHVVSETVHRHVSAAMDHAIKVQEDATVSMLKSQANAVVEIDYQVLACQIAKNMPGKGDGQQTCCRGGRFGNALKRVFKQ